MVAQASQRGPSLVGILNITEDSFSDGGAYLSVENALAHARRLLTDGADIVELGPSSSHPDSKRVTAEEEVARLEPVVSELVREAIPFAVDTFETETQRWSLRQGASMLNDIQGFPDESFWPELANASCDLVVMHSIQDRGPATRESFDEERIVDRVLRFFDDRFAALEQAGVERSRLIADPGMGFFLGSNPEPSVAVISIYVPAITLSSHPNSIDQKSNLSYISCHILINRVNKLQLIPHRARVRFVASTI